MVVENQKKSIIKCNFGEILNTNAIQKLFMLTISILFVFSCQKENNNTIIETIKDIDGNIYHTVTIGKQVWMVENLKTTKYLNGDTIIKSNSSWFNINKGAYSEYDINLYNRFDYGYIYNGYVLVDKRNICPIGWHVSTESDWDTLIQFLGGKEIAGGKLKELGYKHWLSPNTSANNSFGFNALPGGTKTPTGSNYNNGKEGRWCGFNGNINSPIFQLNYDSSSVNKIIGFTGQNGFSIRCVKN